MTDNFTQKAVFKMLIQSIQDKLWEKVNFAEDRIEEEKDRLQKEKPDEVANYDHKDWKWASETIVFWRGHKEAFEEISEELSNFIERSGALQESEEEL